MFLQDLQAMEQPAVSEAETKLSSRRFWGGRLTGPSVAPTRARRVSLPRGKVPRCGGCAALHKTSHLPIARKGAPPVQMMLVSPSDRDRHHRWPVSETKTRPALCFSAS
jgi:hypothetical protein